MRLRKLFSRTDAPDGEWARQMQTEVVARTQPAISRGAVTLYLSHGASAMPADASEREYADTFGFVDWFIVEPRDNPERQVASLRKAGRTVIEIAAEPWNGERDA